MKKILGNRVLPTTDAQGIGLAFNEHLLCAAHTVFLASEDDGCITDAIMDINGGAYAA
jgi:hypothetical protein